MRSKAFLLAGLLVALLVAGGASYFASSHPDGLQYVAEKAGFGDRAEKSPAAHGPLAGYETTGIDSPHLSGGVAGVLGALCVLAAGGGLFWVLRRRTPGAVDETAHDRVEP